METTQLLYFAVVTSIVFWIIVLYFIYYFICKKQFGDKIKQLDKTWKNNKEEYIKDYKQREQYKKDKFDKYLRNNLKKVCFDCRVFDENAKNDYFCCVSGQCPGDDLRKSEKILIMREKESWFKIIRSE